MAVSLCVFPSLSPTLIHTALIDLTNSMSCQPSKPSQYWLEDLCLYPADKESISAGKWITDTVVNAAQMLLQKAYPHIGGLQDTVLAETLAFDIQRGEFVQVLNICRNHWITVTNINCKAGIIAIYDSVPSGRVPSRTRDQIAAMIFCEDKAFTLQFQPVQVQRGSSDCGLFALAFATSLCAGENPERINYVQHLFREHLVKCLTQQAISPFPTTSRSRKPLPQRGSTTVNVFCKCRLPEDGRMIQCDSCKEWYHSHCVTVPESVWSDSNSVWHCASC